MPESEILKRVSEEIDYFHGYSVPEVYITTSSAVLYRVRKAGKFFIIKTAKDKTGQSQARLRREYEMSLGKSHPNIISIFTFEADTVVGPGIVMEYVDGRTLKDFIAENPSQDMRERVFMQLLDAVAYMHRSGVVHNDIKPENILVTRADNDVRLIDFGLADNDAHYLARVLGCTPEYASPELLLQQDDIDARSDIYSLGLIMRDIFGKRHSRIVARCFQFDREKRYANIDDLRRAFSRPYRAIKIFVTLGVVVALMLPLSYYAFAAVEAERKAAECDAMIARIEEDMTVMYEAAADSVSRVPYYEFAVNHILSFYSVAGEYQMANVVSVTDSRFSSALSSAYMKKFGVCVEKLWQTTGELPSFHKCDLSVAAILHYDSLVSNGLPFVPYE